MNTNKDGLKPCPFCGSGNVWLNKCQATVICRSCYCKSPMITKYINQGMNEEDAARTAWNTRYGDA